MSFAFFILSGRSHCFGGHFPIFSLLPLENIPCTLRLYLIEIIRLFFSPSFFIAIFIRPLLSKLGEIIIFTITRMARTTGLEINLKSTLCGQTTGSCSHGISTLSSETRSF